MKRVGKKGREWINERRKRIRELEATGEYVVIKSLLYGNCKDCGRYRCLDLDHIDGRDGIDPHRMSNLDPICRECHILRHNNMANKPENNKKSKSKKADWQKAHDCKHCKREVSSLLCTNCGRMSV